MSGIEIELKLRLASAEDYTRLCARLPHFIAERRQQNTYFDLPDRLLRRARILLRLRVQEGCSWLTVKQAPTIGDDGLFEVPEDEAPLPSDLAGQVLSGERTLESCGGGVLTRLAAAVGELSGLEPWGRLDNLRRSYRLSPEWVVEVDRTEFPGGAVEWEIELEGADPRAGLVLLRPYLVGLDYGPQLRPKSERLLAYLHASDAQG